MGVKWYNSRNPLVYECEWSGKSEARKERQSQNKQIQAREMEDAEEKTHGSVIIAVLLVQQLKQTLPAVEPHKDKIHLLL